MSPHGASRFSALTPPNAAGTGWCAIPGTASVHACGPELLSVAVCVDSPAKVKPIAEIHKSCGLNANSVQRICVPAQSRRKTI